jgi:hypothetical protein
MKKLLFTLLILITTTLLCFSQTIKSLDDKYGFRDAKFEMLLNSFKNLEKFDDEFNGYTLNSANLKLGEYELKDISYYFYDNKLYNIVITVEMGYLNQHGILDILEKAYGKGILKEPSDVEQLYSWKGNKVKMTYDIFDSCGSCIGVIDISCISLERLATDLYMKNHNKKEAEKLQKGVKDL